MRINDDKFNVGVGSCWIAYCSAFVKSCPSRRSLSHILQLQRHFVLRWFRFKILDYRRRSWYCARTVTEWDRVLQAESKQ